MPYARNCLANTGPPAKHFGGKQNRKKHTGNEKKRMERNKETRMTGQNGQSGLEYLR
jgi:hypothetical protein